MQTLSDSDSNIDIPEALGTIAEEFLSRHRQGDKPDIDEFCQRYPEIADRIRDLFPTLLMVEQIGDVSDSQSVQFGGSPLATNCPERIGDFRIVREIGRGGMGIVYEAEQQSLVRRVALKVLPTSASLSPATIERFRRESRAAAKLHHSNIVPVFGVGEDGGIHYYVMQYIEGVGLDQVLGQLARSDRSNLLLGAQPSISASATTEFPGSGLVREDHLYWHRVAFIGMQLANALHFAHSQGVLHRDVKPANVLLDSQGTVWLTDFGLAHAVDDSNITRSGDIVGTLRYLAPERLRGECSRQSDLYGLGITLYELLSFVPAFGDTDRASLLRQVVQQEPKRLRSINRSIPRDLETIVMKAMEKEASRRYATGEELAEDLSRFLCDRPIQARRAILIEQVWRWCRRNPTIAALGATVGLLFLVLMIAWGMFSWVQSDRDRARSAERLAIDARLAANREEGIAEARSHLAQAIGYRYSTEPGHKTKGLGEIEQAIALDPPDGIKFKLRNEAIAALAQTDIKFGRKWTITNESLNGIALDQRLERIAHWDSTGSITIRSLVGDVNVANIQPTIPNVNAATFSKQGNFVLLTDNIQGGEIEVWNVERSEKVVGPLAGCWAFDMDAEEKTLAVSTDDSHVHFYSLATGTETRKIRMSGLPIAISYSGEGKNLALVLRNSPSRVKIFDVNLDRMSMEIEVEGSIRHCNWHPDGDRIALSCSRPETLEIWQVSSRTKLSSMVGHSQEVGASAFNKRGSIVSSGSWDGTLRVWDTITGDSIAVFTKSGYVQRGHESVVAIRQLEGSISAVEINYPEGFQRLTNGNASKISRYTCGDISDDGRMLIAGTYDGLEIWDLAEHRKLASTECRSRTNSLMVNWTDRQLITVGENVGLHRWPIEEIETGWRVGGPTVVDSGSMNATNSSVTPNGNWLAIIDGTNARVLSPHGTLVREIPLPVNHTDVRLSPDGKIMSTFGWFSKTACIWDVHTGQLMKQFEGIYATYNFSPDSKQLICSRPTDYTFLKVQDWSVVRRIERHDCSYASNVAYSPRGDLIALELTWGVLHLLRTDTFQTVALLDSPKRNRPTQFKFACNGDRLIAFHHLAGEVHIWKIDELRERLASMHLDWDDVDRSSIAKSDRAPASPSRIDFSLLDSNPVDLPKKAHRLIEEAERELANSPSSSIWINELAWRLVISPAEFRDPIRAVELMETLQKSESLDANSRNTLAVAYFRVGRFADAISQLGVNLDEQKDDSLSLDLYVLAMCYWQLDQHDRAKETLEWANRMFRLKPPADTASLEELQALRIEAIHMIKGS